MLFFFPFHSSANAQYLSTLNWDEFSPSYKLLNFFSLTVVYIVKVENGLSHLKPGIETISEHFNFIRGGSRSL